MRENNSDDNHTIEWCPKYYTPARIALTYEQKERPYKFNKHEQKNYYRVPDV
ncbi:MAG: hypothetical protein ACXV2F_05530 [Halobacteriota archaeon]